MIKSLVLSLVVLALTISTVGSVASVHAQEPVKKKKEKAANPKLEFGHRFDAGLKQTPDSIARLDKWFRDAKFGVFIHFGAYSSLEGEYKGRGSGHRYNCSASKDGQTLCLHVFNWPESKAITVDDNDVASTVFLENGERLGFT